MNPSCEKHNVFFSEEDTCPACDAVALERDRIVRDLNDEYAQELELENAQWLLVSLSRVIEIVNTGSRVPGNLFK